MHLDRIDHHEYQSHQGRKDEIDGESDELLYVASDFLKLAERFSASLILEYRIGELEGMPDSIRVHLRAESLNDDVDEVVLKVLRNA